GWDVAPERHPIVETTTPEQLSHLVLQRTIATDDELPIRTQLLDYVDEQQRVLLAVQSRDGHRAAPAAAGRAGLRLCHLTLANQRDPELMQPPGTTVAAREARPHDDRGGAPRQHPEKP